MNDEITSVAPSTIPDPGVVMPSPTQRKPRRNAKPKPKPKHAAQRYRNAGPSDPRPSGLRRTGSALRRSVGVPPEGPTMTEKLVNIGETILGAGAASVLGAYAVRAGFHPELVSYVIGGAGLFAATRQREILRAVGLGATSAAGSQIVLLKINPAPAPKVAALPPAPQPPTQPAQLPKPKNADLGTLPPGMLDAAFERARAELAVSADGYPASHEHAPFHIHHGLVYPAG
jgi:hypothetical protein